MESYGKTYEIHVYGDQVSPLWLREYYKNGDEMFKGDYWIDYGCVFDGPEDAIYTVNNDQSLMRTIAVVEGDLMVYETVVHEFDLDQDGRIIDSGKDWEPFYIGLVTRVLYMPDPRGLGDDFEHYFDSVGEAVDFALAKFEERYGKQ